MLQIKNVNLNIGNTALLSNINLSLEQGKIYGILGPNGAGKTTTLECIEGLRKYDEGTIVVNGKTGIQLQSSSLPIHIKPMEAIKLFAKWNLSLSKFRILQVIICFQIFHLSFRIIVDHKFNWI